MTLNVFIRHTFFLLIFGVILGAGSVSAADLSIGEPTAEDTLYAVFPITLTLDAGESMAGLNATLSHSTGLTFHDATASQAALDAGKTLEAYAPETGSVRIVMYDMAHQAIPEGTIAYMRFTVSEAVANGESVAISYSSAVAADDSAQDVSLTTATTFSGTISDLELSAPQESNDDSSGCFISLLTGPASAHADEGPTKTATKAAAPLVIDHTAVDMFDSIPTTWLDQAKQLAIHYAHTSHGSQIVSGTQYLESDDDTYNLILRKSTSEGLPDQEDPPGIRMYDGNPPETYITPEDYWSTESGLNRTKAVADTGSYDLSMWSWCGQQSSNSVETVNNYLDTMKQLEAGYPSMRFILMTGHLGSQNSEYVYSDAERDILKRNNDMVRDFAEDNNMVVFDFADIEGHNGTSYCYENDTHDPYNNLIVECEWPDSPSGCSCAHSVCPNCVRKAKAFWYMMARLAGWDGTAAGCPSPEAADLNEDCTVDADDVSLCVNIILGKNSGSADMNDDNLTNIKDLILIINEVSP